MIPRRTFLGAAGALAPVQAQGPARSQRIVQQTLTLNGSWRFKTERAAQFTEVEVPHTWQTSEELESHYGRTVYEREFDVPSSWRGGVVRIEFEAVFHSAVVTVNGRKAGEHLRKGYTAFWLDVTPMLQFGAKNTIRVEVDNSFDERMLPRGRSSDWSHDGGIYRPVWLHLTPQTFVERVEIDAAPEPGNNRAKVEVRLVIQNATAATSAAWRIVEEASGKLAAEGNTAAGAKIETAFEKPLLWHFDHPHLYRLDIELDDGHRHSETFGVKKFEVRGRAFYLNGEKVRLMGVERMAGSNPTYGMAEPVEWIEHDHHDMRELNCVFTRVHWPQDKRTLDYCDRHGIMIQPEVPTWGPKTFEGMKDEPSAEIMQNGLEQLREMIARDRNHPSVFAWGVCNEIGGQNPPAYQFGKRMYEEAKRLDPSRPATYASHSLMTTPEKDVSREMDFVSWNQYYESWQARTQAELEANLDEIGRAFPDKPVVMSEYGYCACTADRPEGDARRIEIMHDHTRIARQRDFVAGLIFFCYNDYRTHVGDRGTGVLKQRVHGVVDLYGNRKESYGHLRDESSPVETLHARMLTPGKFRISLKCRNSVPAHPMRGYTLQVAAFGYGNVPVERRMVALKDLAAGESAVHEIAFTEPVILSLTIDVLRPTLDSARSLIWRA